MSPASDRDILAVPDWWQDAVARHQFEHDLRTPITLCADAVCKCAVTLKEDAA